MKQFEYTIKDEIGIHARPAGIIAKKAKEFNATITLSKDGKSAELRKLIALMGLGVKCGDTVIVSAEGEDEEAAISAMEQLFLENL